MIMRIMKEKEITVNGYTFSVEPTISDENCYRLMYGGITVLDDTACEDFYGDINTVADVMAEYVREETEKPFPWFTLLDAVVEQGSDPTRIESDEDARSWGETINDGFPTELTDEDDINVGKARLDFDEYDEVKHIYGFGNGNAGTFVLAKDY